MNIPTEEQYTEAQKTIELYEAEQYRLYKIKSEAFYADLKELFKDTYIKEFTISISRDMHYVEIHTTKPYFDENYGGKFDKQIDALAEKHGIRGGFPAHYYGK